MSMSNCLGRGAAVALACLALLVSACESGDSGSSNADVEAGRANVDAMSREHANDTPEPSAATAVAPRRAVVSERLPYAEVNDELVYGHFVFPADMVEPLPAIIMIHEWWGLNDNIRSMADRLAGEGYIVLAVDLFGGETARRPKRRGSECCQLSRTRSLLPRIFAKLMTSSTRQLARRESDRWAGALAAGGR